MMLRSAYASPSFPAVFSRKHTCNGHRRGCNDRRQRTTSLHWGQYYGSSVDRRARAHLPVCNCTPHSSQTGKATPTNQKSAEGALRAEVPFSQLFEDQRREHKPRGEDDGALPSAWQDRFGSLEQSMQGVLERVNGLVDEQSRLKRDNETLLNQVSNSELQAQGLQADLLQLTQSALTWGREADAARKELEVVKAEKAFAEERGDKMQATLDMLEAKGAKLNTALRRAEADLNDLTSELEAASQESMRAASRANAAEADLAAERARNLQMQDAAAAMQADQDAASSELAALKEQLAASSYSYSQMSQQAASLLAERDLARQQMTAAASALTAERDEARLQLTAAAAALAAAQDRVGALERQLADLEGTSGLKMQELQREQESLQQQLRQAVAANSELDRQVTDANVQLQRTSAERIAAENRVTVRGAELAEISARSASLQTELELQQEARRAEVAELRSQLQRAETATAQRDFKVAQLEQQLRVGQQEEGRLRASLLELQTAAQQAQQAQRTDLEELERSRSEAMSREAALEGVLAQQLHQQTQLQQQVDSLKQLSIELQSKLDEALQAGAAGEQRTAAVAAAANAAARSLQGELHTARSEARYNLSSLQQMRQRLVVAEGQLVAATQVATAAKQKAAALQVQVATARSAEADALLERQAAERVIGMLQQRLDTQQTEASSSGATVGISSTQPQGAVLDGRQQLASAIRSGPPAVPLPAPGHPTPVRHTNTQRFHVAPEVKLRFMRELIARELEMSTSQGFLGLAVEEEGGDVTVVRSMWSSTAHWDTWAATPAARRAHMPTGVFQVLPKKGEGVPDDFTPFVQSRAAAATGSN